MVRKLVDSIFDATKLIVSVICCCWIILFSIHFFTEPGFLEDISPTLNRFDGEIFDALASFRLSEFFRQDAFANIDFEPTDPIAEEWADTCGVHEVGKPAQTRLLPIALAEEASDEYKAINSQVFSLQKEFNDLKRTSEIYSAALIALGFFTTVVSALNSSQFGSGDSVRSKWIKILAILFPALTTAVAAYSSLFAPSDLASRKAQAYYSLVSLKSSVIADMSTITCDTATPDQVKTMQNDVSIWSKRYSDVMAGAEVTQGKDDNQNQQQTPQQQKAPAAKL